MLKIRDFARLADVSMVTLRHYDEIGLLKPLRVDPETGYRFYTIDQLPYLHRILALKELGLGLTQIAQILDEGLSSEAFQGMLRLRRAELQERIEAEQEQVERITARLQLFEQGGCMPAYEVVLKTIRPFTVVFLYVPLTGVHHKWRYAHILLDMLKQHGVKPIDHLLFLYEDNSEDEHTKSGLQVALPVTHEDAIALVAASEGRIACCELPAVSRMASVLHRGNPYRVLEAHQALGTWIETNRYAITGGPRRVICLRKDCDPDDYLIEVQFPVEKVS